MDSIIDRIKSDTLNGIMELTGKSWIPITLAQVLYSIISTIVMLPIIANMLGIGLDDISNIMQNQNDPMAIQRQMEGIMSEVSASFGVGTVLGIILIILVSLFASAWIYNVAFKSIKIALDGGKPNLGEVLSNSFDNKVIRIFLASILMGVLGMVLYLLVVMLGFIPYLGALLIFAGVIMLILFFIRLVLVLPIVAYENTGIMEAVNISLESITWGKAAKYFLLGILAMIALLVVSFIFGLLSSALAAIPVLGSVVGMIINGIIGGIMMTAMVATSVALYVKYRGLHSDDNDIDKHLIYDN